MATFNIKLSIYGAGHAGAQVLSGMGTVSGESFASGLHKVRDMEHGGDGTITGNVAIKGSPNNLPVARKVRLVRDVDALCIRETWSDPLTGAYAFPEIDRTVSYTVLSYDHTELFRAVVADRIVPLELPP